MLNLRSVVAALYRFANPRDAFVTGRKDLHHQVRKPRRHRIALGRLPPSKKQQGTVRGLAQSAHYKLSQVSLPGRTDGVRKPILRETVISGLRRWTAAFQPALAMEITWSRASLNRPVGIFDLPRPIVLGVVAFLFRRRFASIGVHDVSLLKACAI